MKLSDFDFNLPKSLIAQYPHKKRTGSKLLVAGESFVDTTFSQLGKFLQPNDLLVLNDTKVIPARLYAQKDSGGKVEVLVERLIDKREVLAMIKASRAPKIGSYIVLENGQRAQVANKSSGLYNLVFETNSILGLLDKIGHVPLPPYIERSDEKRDIDRYQTVYAKKDGAVAAPTAGLHFDKILLSELTNYGVKHDFVTLHVGAGTFQPVKTEAIENHRMHSEFFEVNQDTIEKIKNTKASGGRVVAVGTTAVRTLESIALHKDITAQKGETDIFIYPGFEFSLVDAMITNFHLPKSSLLMLVSAFIGHDKMIRIYQHAINKEYRFFSYGDAMLLEKKTIET
ncbi:MAG: tRNA preQ1(34) S-adenosylmethionine ribosyltransferase-isomerase QueA [Candidatus Thioglobus sp.]|jgi:S-adenosylmethionine:tRNA ribosyltransferase-isomerase|nr:tRNA preQ1(34) S-adenosylmethionine ribosyltransferase-isomerase QueA [Candidatus Thioglobus sp.]